MTHFPWLTTIVLLPLLLGLFIPLLPGKGNRIVRWYALAVCLVDFLLITYVFVCKYDLHSSSLQLVEDYIWIPSFYLHWHLGVDGLSIGLILLTGMITTLATLSAWPVTRNPKLFYFLMLAMYTGQIGLFASQDLLLFFLMWEFELIPVYILVSLWGGRKRLYAATKFILYTAISSLFILACGLTMAFYGPEGITFQMDALALKNYPLELSIWLYLGFLISYAVKLPAFPVHTWLPDTHGEAHYSTCMLLAGVLLKMGGYALIRINMGLLPNAHAQIAPWLAVVGVINIVYAALTSFAQRNLKRKIAYSSISHMGFVLLGIASLNELGLQGAMLQMISHGLIGASLFFLAGTAYDRTRTLMLENMGGLATVMPKMFAMFTACSLASLALPGMSGFVAELLVFVGFATSESYSPLFRAVIVTGAAFGILLTPIYLLSACRQAFYGSSTKLDMSNGFESFFSHEESHGAQSDASGTEPEGHLVHQQRGPSFWDASPREVFIVACLLIPMIGIGLYPKMVSSLYSESTEKAVQVFVQAGTKIF
uniref:subunit 4 of NADH-plastoquinone oxidoreductase n=1 Tax=Streptofilum capillatum TaxID=2058781 RepID=UPI00286AD9D4|nr:subunit 4 of NADH-plastoquinone oxidoreductase [Streptofilum capillatum]WKT08510.1 subunit 4 of NADH-plastoquinone oxidoreductase [Streptofilum capillatum]WKT08609.1 subunit 4 of NADH-plastoquinone oxidoreductase [Streptofilum sp. BC4-VF8pt]WKT08708.1 subunit 4 of NADH-plastoquinone oxidoreductase [Streptofilum sp. ZNP2-VF4pt]